MRIVKDVVLKPLVSGKSSISRKQYYEQVEMYIDGYPACMLSAGNFYDIDSSIFEALIRGRELRLKMCLESWDELPQYNNGDIPEENDENDKNEDE